MLPKDWGVLGCLKSFQPTLTPGEGYLPQTKDTVATHKNRPTNDIVFFVHMYVFLTSLPALYHILMIRFNNRDSKSGLLDWFSWSDGKNPWEEAKNERGYGADDIWISNFLFETFILIELEESKRGGGELRIRWGACRPGWTQSWLDLGKKYLDLWSQTMSASEIPNKYIHYAWKKASLLVFL